MVEHFSSQTYNAVTLKAIKSLHDVYAGQCSGGDEVEVMR